MDYMYDYRVYIALIAIVIAYLFKVFYSSRRSFIPYNNKLILYFCTELSFSPSLWPKFIDDLREQKPLTVPKRAILKGAIHYPLERAFLLILTIFAVAPFAFPILGRYFSEGTLGHEDFIFLSILSFIPPLLYYFTPFSTDVYSTMKNQLVVEEYLRELGWHLLPHEELEKIYKEVHIDYLLYKKNSDIGALLIIIGSASMLIYSRLINTDSVFLLPFLIVLFMALLIPKSFYEGFRTRVLLIALNTLLEIIHTDLGSLDKKDNNVSE